MKKLQYILPIIILVIFLILIYFALYQVEGFAISEVNRTLDASGVAVEGAKRIIYLSLFYLLTLCFTALFIVNGKECKLLFLIFGIGIALFGYKIYTSNLLLCNWGYCSIYGYVDLIINMFLSLTVAYVISLLSLFGYYCYKKFMHKRRK